MQNYYIDTIIHHIISPQYFSSSSSSSSAFLSTVYNGFEFHDPEVLHLNHNSPHHNQPTGSKSISTHWKSKSKSNPPEIKIKINPPENKNKNQPTVNLLRRRPMVSTEIPETSHGFHWPAVGASPVPLEDSFLGLVESLKRKATMWSQGPDLVPLQIYLKKKKKWSGEEKTQRRKKIQERKEKLIKY
jgi:hypothetical protein